MTHATQHPGLTIATIIALCCLQGCSPSAQPPETAEQDTAQKRKRSVTGPSLEGTTTTSGDMPAGKTNARSKTIISKTQTIEVRDPAQTDTTRRITIPKDYVGQQTIPAINPERPATALVGTERWREMSPEERQKEAMKAFAKTAD